MNSLNLQTQSVFPVLLACYFACVQQIPDIHLQWPAWQAVSSTCLHTCISVAPVQDQVCHCLTACNKTTPLFAEPHHFPSWAKYSKTQKA